MIHVLAQYQICSVIVIITMSYKDACNVMTYTNVVHKDLHKCNDGYLANGGIIYLQSYESIV